MDAMYKRYANYSPVGAAYLYGTFGMLVYDPDEYDKYDCDYVCSWNNGENEWGFHKHKIHYSTSGRAFIRKVSLRIYLDNIMRV